MKVFSFVLLGISASVGVYLLAMKWILSAYPHLGGCGMVAPFLILIPSSMLAGGMVTGLLSRGNLETKWMLFGIAPGLYIGISCAVPNLTIGLFGYALLISIYCYLLSLAGVGLGYLLRAGISRWVFGRSG